MFTIAQTDYGIKLSFQGPLTEPEIIQWSKEVKLLIKKQKQGFGVLVDVRHMGTLLPSCIPIVVDVQNFAQTNGALRTGNIVDSQIAKMQQTRMAKDSGLYSFMRYIDASAVNNPETVALDWIVTGKDPD